jgi:hypothetical protein
MCCWAPSQRPLLTLVACSLRLVSASNSPGFRCHRANSRSDRKDQLEVKNSSKVDDFRQVLLDRAHETEHKLKEFVSNQTSQYEDLKDSIANFVERKNNVSSGS